MWEPLWFLSTRLETFVLPVPFGAPSDNRPESGLLQEELIEGLR